MLFGRALTCDKGALVSRPLTLHFYLPFSPHQHQSAQFFCSAWTCVSVEGREREKNTFQMTYSLFPSNWILTLLAPPIYVILSRWMQAVRPYLPSCLLGECLTLIIFANLNQLIDRCVSLISVKPCWPTQTQTHTPVLLHLTCLSLTRYV